jgi:hypothetical protein
VSGVPPNDGQFGWRLMGAERSFSWIWTDRRVVVRSQAEWEALWAEHVTAPPPYAPSTQEPIPEVDFDFEIVVAVFAGYFGPSSGVGLNVQSVDPQDDGCGVTYLETLAGPCPLPGIAFAPCFFVAVRNAPGPVTYTRNVTTQTCP